jgi:hypothetical protein
MIAGLDSADNTSKLLLCGSRGVGGVVAVTSQGVTLLELLDLEEDEEAEEDEDGEEFDEEEK